MIDESLDALRAAGIGFWVRKGPSTDLDLPRGGEVDLAIRPSATLALDTTLRRTGFLHLAAPGHEPHRFYVGFDGSRWIKLDVKVMGRGASASVESEEREAIAPGSDRTGPLRRVVNGARRRRPASGNRRRGPVIALLGPDGAGKGTVIEAVRHRIPVAVTVAYMGGGPRRGRAKRVQARVGPRAGVLLESALVMAGFLRAWRKLLRGYSAAWRGDVVLFDRHTIEILAVRPERGGGPAALERFVLTRLVPWPDAIVVLDAPASVLFERKGEHPVERLDRWRRAYETEFRPRGARVVSTAGEVDQAVSEVSAVVW